VGGKNPLTNRRIEAERFFNFADALTAEVIQVQRGHGGAAHGCDSFDFLAFELEVVRPELADRVK